MTVGKKISKKQQREAEKKRRAAGREKQQRYVNKQKAAGKTLFKIWVTAEEKKVFEKVRSMLPKLVELERKEAVSTNQQETSKEEEKEEKTG